MNEEFIFASLIKNSKEDLNKYFLDDEIKKIDSFKKVSFSFDEIFSESILDNIHYSWFVPILNIYEEDKELLILSLDEKSKKSLLKILNIELKNNNVSAITKRFSKKILFNGIVQDKKIIPKNFLKDCDLSFLLDFSKEKLIKIIDFLSLYDLSKELKKLVKKDIIDQIFSYLTNDEQNFLKSISKKIETFPYKNFDLKSSLKNKNTFRKNLHKFGLLRFSMALSLENVDLIWYICHYLDVGRGSFILNELSKNMNLNACKAIKNELIKNFK